MKLFFETALSLPFERIRDQFGRELFTHLSAHIVPFQIKRFDGCKTGDEIHIELGTGGLRQEWVSLITFEETNASGWSFIDEGKVLPWPLKYWKHHHRVDKIGPQESRIVDDITFECSPRILAPIVKPILWSVFAMRPGRYQKFFKD